MYSMAAVPAAIAANTPVDPERTPVMAAALLPSTEHRNVQCSVNLDAATRHGTLIPAAALHLLAAWQPAITAPAGSAATACLPKLKNQKPTEEAAAVGAAAAAVDAAAATAPSRRRS
jgi:hypothetical protein